MAKNISQEDLATTRAEPSSEPQHYVGTFEGDLTGNADTATLLKNSFTITASQDAQGTFSTAGTNQTFPLHITRADKANQADFATKAGTVANADYAVTAGSANTASTAGSASFADSAKMADHATVADNATSADSAKYATRAGEADHAANADNATKATTASLADVATVAKALENPESPVQEAEHARKADLATMAQYDCEGYSFKDMYAKKADYVSKQEAFTKEEAQILFAERGKLLQTASVVGKAFGSGVVKGTDLVLNITSIASGESASFYSALVYLTGNELPSKPDTTKIYITADGRLWLYSQDALSWIDVKSALSTEEKGEINEALDKLGNVVDLTSDQIIKGEKTFKEIPSAPISSIRDDPDRNVVVLHNLREVRDDINADISELTVELQGKLDVINSRLDAQQTGDVLFAYKDYSLPENQPDMIVGTTYIGLLEEDKTFIQLDPEDNSLADPSQVPYWWRYYRKDSKGHITWQDYKINSAIFVDYARLDGANFTGNVTVQNREEPLSLTGLDVLNIHDTRIIVDDLINKAIENADLDQYMPLSGGTFTGKVYVGSQVDVASAPVNIILNKGDIQKLIEQESSKVVRLDAYPVDGDGDYKKQTIYAVPAVNSASPFGGEISEINLYEGQPVTIDMVSDGELAGFVSSNLIAD